MYYYTSSLRSSSWRTTRVPQYTQQQQRPLSFSFNEVLLLLVGEVVVVVVGDGISGACSLSRIYYYLYEQHIICKKRIFVSAEHNNTYFFVKSSLDKLTQSKRWCQYFLHDVEKFSCILSNLCIEIIFYTELLNQKANLHNYSLDSLDLLIDYKKKNNFQKNHSGQYFFLLKVVNLYLFNE